MSKLFANTSFYRKFLSIHGIWCPKKVPGIILGTFGSYLCCSLALAGDVDVLQEFTNFDVRILRFLLSPTQILLSRYVSVSRVIKIQE